MYVAVKTTSAISKFMPGPASSVAARQRLGASLKLPLPTAPSSPHMRTKPPMGSQLSVYSVPGSSSSTTPLISCAPRCILTLRFFGRGGQGLDGLSCQIRLNGPAAVRWLACSSASSSGCSSSERRMAWPSSLVVRERDALCSDRSANPTAFQSCAASHNARHRRRRSLCRATSVWRAADSPCQIPARECRRAWRPESAPTRAARSTGQARAKRQRPFQLYWDFPC